MLKYRPLPILEQLNAIRGDPSTQGPAEREKREREANEAARTTALDCFNREGFQWVLYALREAEGHALAQLQAVPVRNPKTGEEYEPSAMHKPEYWAGMIGAVDLVRKLLAGLVMEHQEGIEQSFAVEEAGLYPELPAIDQQSAD